MRKIFFVLVFFTLKYIEPTVAQGINIQDSLALVDFYDSTKGDNWKWNDRWKTSAPVSTWYGVGVSKNRVVSLNFMGNKMIGLIPTSFGNLTALQRINFIDNGLQADLSTFLDKFTSLVTLHIGERYFTKKLPASISHLTDLTEFTLYGSLELTKLPSFKNLPKLKMLDIQLNGLVDDISGSIPDSLEFLIVASNKLTFTSLEKLAKRVHYFDYQNQGNIRIIKQDDKLMVAAGGTLGNNTYKWYKAGTGLVETNKGDSVFYPASPGVYYAQVSNDIASIYFLTSDTANAISAKVKTCIGSGSVVLSSSVSGSGYQWQVSTDSISYSNISDDMHYAGTNASSLKVSNIPSGWGGYRYRCIADGKSGIFYTISFANSWTGTMTTAWENAGNWSCGTVPEENTDVIIQSGNIAINSNVTVKSLKVQPGSTVQVNPGFSITIKK